MNKYFNRSHSDKGNGNLFDTIAWTPYKATATSANQVVAIKKKPGMVARLYVETDGVTVTLYDDTDQVWPGLTGAGEDEFVDAPIFFGESINLKFSGAGTAFILYR